MQSRNCAGGHREGHRDKGDGYVDRSVAETCRHRAHERAERAANRREKQEKCRRGWLGPDGGLREVGGHVDVASAKLISACCHAEVNLGRRGALRLSLRVFSRFLVVALCGIPGGCAVGAQCPLLLDDALTLGPLIRALFALLRFLLLGLLNEGRCLRVGLVDALMLLYVPFCRNFRRPSS